METKRSYRYFNILMLVGLVLGLGFYFSYLKSPTKITPPQARAAGSACNMVLGTDPVAFCDTFDAPAGIGNRSGQLNGTIWGVSRTTGDMGLGGLFNSWSPTQIQECDGTTPTVSPPNDIIICGGQLRESQDDNVTGVFEAGTVTALTMYPKQPFDFAGRTGTVSFDVGDDSNGTHGAWPEFWMSNLPVPAPFSHFATWKSLPQYGFGIRFGGFVNSSGQGASCPEGSSPPGKSYIGVDSAIIINNYVGSDTADPNFTGNVNLEGFDCVKQPAFQGQLNHFEIRVSTSQIDVYGWDAGVTPTVANEKHLATIFNANLGFTRGLIWIEDVHYNADKVDPTNPALSQRVHTFVWDNVAFDGPFTYRDLSYDALDNSSPPTTGSDGGINLGKLAQANGTASWNVLNMPANPTADAVRVLFNVYVDTIPSGLNITVNGNAHTGIAWPYPDNLTSSWRTFAYTIPITDLVTGTNVVAIGSNQPMVTSNVNIVLVNGSFSGNPTPPPPPVVPPPPPPDTIPPTVSISSPTSGSTVSGSSVAITANASDNVAVAGVQFKLDGSNLGSLDTTSPYAINWDSTTATNGSHTLTAVATDTSNNSTTSTSVSVTVNNGVVTPPPPPPPGSWINITGTSGAGGIGNLASECGNLTSISAVPGSSTILAGIALDSIWSNSSGSTWSKIGIGAGSATINNRPMTIIYDPTNPSIFWEAGIYGSNGGVYKTTNGGVTFTQLGSVTHTDSVSIDFTDPNRMTLVAGGHEQNGQKVYKSTDGGNTWTNIGLNLPAGTGFSEDPLVINSQTYIVNTYPSWGGGTPGIYRTINGGTSWTKVSSEPANQPVLVAPNGTIYYADGNGLVKSSDNGVTWTAVGSGLLSELRPMALQDGRLVSASSTNLMISSDGGSTWSTIGANLPYAPNYIIYSNNRKAFFISHWDCGSVVLPDAVEELDMDLGFGTNQLPVGNFDGLKSDGVTLQGWSYDPDSTSTSNNVQIFVNGPVGTGTLIFSGPTSILRTDVNTTFSITGNHGFEFAIPSQYQDGVSHSYYVYGIDVNDGTKSTLLTGSPLSFTVGGSSTYQRTISIASLDGRSTKVISGSLDVLNSSKGLIKTYAFTTNSSGTATITFDIPTQTVFLKVRALPFLTRLLSNVNLANNTTYAFPILLTGDINQDDIVNSIDFSILNSHWFTTDATSDLNQDGLVNSLDFSLLNKNWFVSGEQ